MTPRLRLDIEWRDLVSVIAPPGRPAALQARIADSAPGNTTAVVGLSVRTLFDAILEAIALAPGDIVAAGAVNIAGMATLIRDHGAEIRPVDLDLDTLAPRPDAFARAASGARLVLIAHLYGGRNPVPGLVGEDPGPLIVEDCAQAFDGALTLSPGADVALYSFGPIKIATALGGGVALFRDPELAERVAAIVAGHPPLNDGWFLRRAAKYAVLKTLSQPVLFGGLHRLLRALPGGLETRLGGVARGFSSPGSLQQAIRRRPPPRLLALMARRLDQTRTDGAAVDLVLDAIARLNRLPGAKAALRGRWLCPVLADDPDRLIAGLTRHGFDATRGATSLGVLPGGDAPEAERLMRSVVYAPRPADAVEARRLIATLAALVDPRPSTAHDAPG